MRSHRSCVSGCLALLVLSACGGGGKDNTQSSQTPTPPTPPPTSGCPALPSSTATAGTLAAIVDASAASEMQAKTLPGMTIAIAKDGTLLYAQGYGYKDIASCAPVQADTEFQIGSITKQFTAATVLKLHEAGAIDLDRTAASYLPGYGFDERITVRMLLVQTAGLADYTEFPQAQSWIPGVSQATVLTAIAQIPVRFAPGSAHEYSNSNYFLLGSIIEAVSGSTYEDDLASRILQPLHLAHTSTQQPLTGALPYTYSNGSASPWTAGIIPDRSGFFAAGALWSNVQDLTAWNAALRNGSVISPATFTMMVTPPPAMPVHEEPSIASPYAMGWVSETLLDRPFIWHNGQTLAYTSFNGVFLDNGFSVSVLTNIDVREDTPLLPFAQALIQSICTSAATAATC